ncbi:hypothetical protein FRC10_001962 [Ceratobasidium sp. 414]|nr:hypothetical protein FRC10_001962 [Ceratobasidium sp. 414]
MTKQLLMLTAKITELSLFLPRFVVNYLLQEPQYPFALRRLCIEPLDSEGFTTFLETQPYIEHGHFLYHSVHPLNPNILLRLKSIEAAPATILNLVPKRPVSVVQIESPIDHAHLPTIHHALRQSSASLTRLSIRIRIPAFPWYNGALDLLSGLDYCRESLKVLTIVLHPITDTPADVSLHWFLTYTERDHTNPQCDSNPSLGFGDVRKSISAFSKLEKLKIDISIAWDRALPPGFRDSIPELSRFQVWKGLCPTLREVDLCRIVLKD